MSRNEQWWTVSGKKRCDMTIPSSFAQSYDVIVVGGGHAGCEAALASARVGARTLMLALNLDTIGAMPCNCSIGGPGKSQLVSEIDALGGEMGRACDRTFTHARVLNASKGPAVQSLRCQADKAAYRATMKERLEREPLISTYQDAVMDVLVTRGAVVGVGTAGGLALGARAVVICTGTFLNGVVHIGDKQVSGGRAGESAAERLTDSLRRLGLTFRRFKTGTVPRLRKSSLAIERMRVQPSDARPLRFSVMEQSRPPHRLLPCYITHTTEETHGLLIANLERSALHAGHVSGAGPRYCPSIETKLVRFPDRTRHQVFMQQEGWQTEEVYAQGLYNSMPYEVQVSMVRSVPGCERAEITRPGYAIEYDCIDPRALSPGLEYQKAPGLFLAGQVNGTSGYEEAGAQGLVAGANAAASALKLGTAVEVRRDQGYIGVMIDDLISRGADEPYRILTSRAEFRILLGQHTAYDRLTSLGARHGLVSLRQQETVAQLQANVKRELDRLLGIEVPSGHPLRARFPGMSVARDDALSAAELLRQPGVSYDDIGRYWPAPWFESAFEMRVVEATSKCEAYAERENARALQAVRSDCVALPPELDYRVLPLRGEARERLAAARPRTLGEARQLFGVTPADLAVLMAVVRGGDVSRETSPDGEKGGSG